MDPLITSYLSELKLGELQIFRNMAVAPLFTSLHGGPDYGLLGEAIDATQLTITELDQSGSVPELKVVNTFPRPILLLDGEELVGAKQNRVLNTSILLKANSETVIPVSCTEQGRWRYTSTNFADSDVIMSHRSRATKTLTVTGSLRAGRGYSSDQMRVWADINTLHGEAGTASRTLAMRDVYTAKTDELEPYLHAFECISHQRGILVLINDQPAGFDVLSREQAYQTLHAKLVNSYAIDALLQRKNGSDAPSLDTAHAFVGEARSCQESRFPSAGQGYDYRFIGARMVGSALVVQQSIIHLAFFRVFGSERGDTKSSNHQRRAFRPGKG